MPQTLTKIRSQATLNPQTWYKAAVTFDGTTAILYLNGSPVATAPIITPFEWKAPQLRFGQLASTKATAVRVDGANDYITIPNSDSLNITGAAITIEAWVRFSSASDRGIIAMRGVDGVNSPWGLDLVKRQLVFYVVTSSGDYSVTSQRIIAPDQFHHVAAVLGSGALHLYLNGVEEAVSYASGAQQSSSPIPVVGNIITSTGTVSFGNFVGVPGSSHLNGDLAEVRIWNSARTAVQILAGLNRVDYPQSGLVALYEMNETSGAIINDASGNANHGTLTNGPIWINSIGGITMDELRVWTTVRTPSQLAESFGGEITPPVAGLLAQYHFEETTGSSAADASTNNNHAALSGTWLWEGTAFSGAAAYGGKVEINLWWDPIVDAQSYNVKRSATSGGAYTLLGNTIPHNYRDVNVVPGTSYYYKVYPVTDAVEGTPSQELTAIPTAVPAETPAPKLVVVLGR